MWQEAMTVLGEQVHIEHVLSEEGHEGSGKPKHPGGLIEEGGGGAGGVGGRAKGGG